MLQAAGNQDPKALAEYYRGQIAMIDEQVGMLDQQLRTLSGSAISAAGGRAIS